MRKQSAEKQFVAFVFACLLGLVLTFIGLRYYFNDTRLNALLTQTIAAEQLKIVAGQAHLAGGALLVDGTQPDALSLISADNLRIDSDLYDALTLTFSEKHLQQSLSVVFHFADGRAPVKEPVLYTNALKKRFVLSETVPRNVLISGISLQTRHLITPYRIEKIRFHPKPLDNLAFVQLLGGHFVTNKAWRDSSIQSHRSETPLLWTPKLLIMIYFSVVGVLFGLYLLLMRQPLLNAWWAVGVASWFALDAHYLIEKTHIVQHNWAKRHELKVPAKDTTTTLNPKKMTGKTSTEHTKLTQVMPENNTPTIQLESLAEEKSTEIVQ